jgi:hypothetical protein
MPRRSRADIEMDEVAPPSRAVTLAAPESLSPAARAAFVTLVGSCEPGHFQDCDVSLIARYAVAIIMCERAEAALQADPNDGKALALWEKATRAMSGLALRLRLGPQSRREKAKVGRPLSWSDRFALDRLSEQQDGGR